MKSFLWCHQESNRGRKGKNSRIQSFALLTQKRLPHNEEVFSVVPPGIEPGTQGQEFRASSPLLYQYKSAYVKQKDFLVNEEVFSVVPPGIEPGTQGPEFKNPVLCSANTKKDFLITKKSFLCCHQESTRGRKAKNSRIQESSPLFYLHQIDANNKKRLPRK